MIKNLFFEYAGESFNADEIVKAVKADWVAMGNKVKEMADAKIYVKPEDGKAYYVLGDDILCKKYDVNHPNGVYPDGGVSFETYVCGAMIEFETLGELKTVAPGEVSEHKENWTLVKKPCDADFKDDNSIENLISKI